MGRTRLTDSDFTRDRFSYRSLSVGVAPHSAYKTSRKALICVSQCSTTERSQLRPGWVRSGRMTHQFTRSNTSVQLRSKLPGRFYSKLNGQTFCNYNYTMNGSKGTECWSSTVHTMWKKQSSLVSQICNINNATYTGLEWRSTVKTLQKPDRVWTAIGTR